MPSKESNADSAPFDWLPVFERAKDVALRRLPKHGLATVTDDQCKIAYQAGADEIERVIGGQSNLVGTKLAAGGFGNSSLAQQLARDAGKAVVRAKEELSH